MQSKIEHEYLQKLIKNWNCSMELSFQSRLKRILKLIHGFFDFTAEWFGHCQFDTQKKSPNDQREKIDLILINKLMHLIITFWKHIIDFSPLRHYSGTLSAFLFYSNQCALFFLRPTHSTWNVLSFFTTENYG